MKKIGILFNGAKRALSKLELCDVIDYETILVKDELSGALDIYSGEDETNLYLLESAITISYKIICKSALSSIDGGCQMLAKRILLETIENTKLK